MAPHNTTLREDGESLMLICCEALGMTEVWLRNDAGNDVSNWYGITTRGGRVTEIDWSHSGLAGFLPPELEKLSALTLLRLDGNSLGGSIPEEIGSLSNLEYLWLSDNNFYGAVPLTFSNLRDLVYLGLDGNDLIEDVPDFALTDGLETQAYIESLGVLKTQRTKMGDLLKRDKAILMSCYKAMGGTLDKLKNGGRDDVSRWRGVTVDDLRVVEVNWHNKRLKGSIPPLLAELDALRVLNLGGNDLSGELPEELGNMKSLEHLILNHNKLHGGFPDFLARLASSLRVLILSSNKHLDGPIPAWIGSISNLTHLHLDDNGFTGEVPCSLTKLDNLVSLHLQGNHLAGDAPSRPLDDDCTVQKEQFGDSDTVDSSSIASDGAARSSTGAPPAKLNYTSAVTGFDADAEDSDYEDESGNFDDSKPVKMYLAKLRVVEDVDLFVPLLTERLNEEDEDTDENAIASAIRRKYRELESKKTEVDELKKSLAAAKAMIKVYEDSDGNILKKLTNRDTKIEGLSANLSSANIEIQELKVEAMCMRTEKKHLEIQLASKNDKIIRAMCELASGDAGLKSCMKPLLEEETKEGGGAGA